MYAGCHLIMRLCTTCDVYVFRVFSAVRLNSCESSVPPPQDVFDDPSLIALLFVVLSLLSLLPDSHTPALLGLAPRLFGHCWGKRRDYLAIVGVSATLLVIMS